MKKSSHRWITITTAGVLSAGLIFGGATAANASTLAPAAGSSGSCSVAAHLRSIFAAMPAQLRTDLTDLRDLPADQRRAAARQIRADALSGGYGEAVQTRAKQIAALRVQIRKDMPAELKSDLAELKAAAPGADRRADAMRIAREAVAGSYGSAVQDAAERIQGSDLWQDCHAG